MSTEKRFKLELHPIEEGKFVCFDHEYTAHNLDGLFIISCETEREARALNKLLGEIQGTKGIQREVLILYGLNEFEAFVVEVPREANP